MSDDQSADDTVSHADNNTQDKQEDVYSEPPQIPDQNDTTVATNLFPGDQTTDQNASVLPSVNTDNSTDNNNLYAMPPSSPPRTNTSTSIPPSPSKTDLDFSPSFSRSQSPQSARNHPYPKYQQIQDTPQQQAYSLSPQDAPHTAPHLTQQLQIPHHSNPRQIQSNQADTHANRNEQRGPSQQHSSGPVVPANINQVPDRTPTTKYTTVNDWFNANNAPKTMSQGKTLDDFSRIIYGIRLVSPPTTGTEQSKMYEMKLTPPGKNLSVLSKSGDSAGLPIGRFSVDGYADIATSRSRSKTLATKGYYDLTVQLPNLDPSIYTKLRDHLDYLAKTVGVVGEKRSSIFKVEDNRYCLSVRVFERITSKRTNVTSQGIRISAVSKIPNTDDMDVRDLKATDELYTEFEGDVRVDMLPNVLTVAGGFIKMVSNSKQIVLKLNHMRNRAGLMLPTRSHIATQQLPQVHQDVPTKLFANLDVKLSADEQVHFSQLQILVTGLINRGIKPSVLVKAVEKYVDEVSNARVPKMSGPNTANIYDDSNETGDDDDDIVDTGGLVDNRDKNRTSTGYDHVRRTGQVPGGRIFDPPPYTGYNK